MVANTAPIFSRQAHVSWVNGITAANTAKDGTGTVDTVFTADATNGSFLQKLIIRPRGTNVVSVLRVFLNNGSTNATAANNLIANGYNFYGSYATANDQFVFTYPGLVSGPFEWVDSYVNQIWLNNALQLAILSGLVQAKSVPYNQVGYTTIRAWCMDPILAALNFGAIRAGVTLSQAQIAEVNGAAGVNIANTLSNEGFFLQVKDATPQVRAARGSPPCPRAHRAAESRWPGVPRPLPASRLCCCCNH